MSAMGRVRPSNTLYAYAVGEVRTEEGCDIGAQEDSALNLPTPKQAPR